MNAFLPINLKLRRVLLLIAGSVVGIIAMLATWL